MNEMSSGDAAKTWWQSNACYANRWYAIGIVVATLFAFSIPHLLGPLIPCAEFMEVEWVAVAVTSLTGVGLLNILFSFAPFIEASFAWECYFSIESILAGCFAASYSSRHHVAYL